jgi:hypothetical protein
MGEMVMMMMTFFPPCFACKRNKTVIRDRHYMALSVQLQDPDAKHELKCWRIVDGSCATCFLHRPGRCSDAWGYTKQHITSVKVEHMLLLPSAGLVDLLGLLGRIAGIIPQYCCIGHEIFNCGTVGFPAKQDYNTPRSRVSGGTWEAIEMFPRTILLRFCKIGGLPKGRPTNHSPTVHSGYVSTASSKTPTRTLAILSLTLDV